MKKNKAIEKINVIIRNPELASVLVNDQKLLADERIEFPLNDCETERDKTTVNLICSLNPTSGNIWDIIVDCNCYGLGKKDDILCEKIKGIFKDSYSVRAMIKQEMSVREERSIYLGIRTGLLFDTDGRVNSEVLSSLGAAISTLVMELLDSENNLYDLFLDNFPMLFRNKDLIFNTPDYYCSVIGTGFVRCAGTHNIGNRKVMLGTMFKAFTVLPEWLRVPRITEDMLQHRRSDKENQVCNCGSEYLLTGSGGSPLTGVGGGDCVCPVCGNVIRIFTDHNFQRIPEFRGWLDKDNAANNAEGKPLYKVIWEIRAIEAGR